VVGSSVAATLTSGSGDEANDPGRRSEDDVNLVAYRKAQKAHYAEDCERWEVAEEANTLNTQGDTAGNVALGAAVRRLTPTECERLQGLPDGWTCLCGVEPYSTEACRCTDSARYRAVGDAVTTNVAYWIGRRILAFEGGDPA
jgi:site-specific DNA-cytosine methylase